MHWQGPASGKAQNGPVVDARIGDEKGQSQHGDIGEAGVEGIIADAAARELNGAPVRNEKNEPGDQRGCGDGKSRIGVEVEPSVHLPHLLPPGIADQDRCAPAYGDKQRDQGRSRVRSGRLAGAVFVYPKLVSIPYDPPSDDGRARAAPEFSPAERGVAAFRERLLNIIRPFGVHVEDRHIGGVRRARAFRDPVSRMLAGPVVNNPTSRATPIRPL